MNTIERAAAGKYEILGELGADAWGTRVYLARDLAASGLVALRLQRRPGGDGASELQARGALDSSVPALGGECPTCFGTLSGWGRFCPRCGSDISGVAPGEPAGASPAELLTAARAAATDRYRILGAMPRAEGGGLVYFASDAESGRIAAMRLERTEEGQFRLAVIGTMPAYRPASEGDAPTPVAAAAGAATAPLTQATRVCPSCGTEYEASARFCPRDGSALVAKADDELLGRVVADRYRVLRKLGEGGMGRVYLAEHVRMGRPCALKVLNPELVDSPDAIARFAREASSASRINHPNVASVYDFGETEDGIAYLAMEYAEGERLSTLIAREGPFPPERAVAIARQVADALITAHELGIVHRDLKPDNILVSRARDGSDLVKVIDFGIAKGPHGTDTQLTRTGFVVGTPKYMSPEQVSGEPVDGRTDIYSLGCILYEMLVGQPAFDGPTAELIMRRLTEPPPQPRRQNPRIPKELDEVVVRALARSTADRYASAAEFLAALSALSSVPAPPVIRTPTPTPAPAAAAPPRRRVSWPVAAAVLLGLLATGVLAWVTTRNRTGVATDSPMPPPTQGPADTAALGVAGRDAPVAGPEREQPPPATAAEREPARDDPPPRTAQAEPRVTAPATRPQPAAQDPEPQPSPSGPTPGEIAEIRRELAEIDGRLRNLSDVLEYDPILRQIRGIQDRLGNLLARSPGSAVLDSLSLSAQARVLETRRVCEQIKQLRQSRGAQAPTCS